jgi:tetratricopeptide (TPR) repeat protein
MAFEAKTDTSRAHIDAAARAARAAAALDARSPETYRLRGIVEQYRLDFDKAVEFLEEAVRVAPSDAESQRRLAVVYVIRGKADEALKAAERAASDDPRNIASYTTLGLIHQFRAATSPSSGGQEYEAALKAYEQGLKLAPDPGEYGSTQYADVLVYLQRHERAADVLSDRVARARDSYMDYYKLAKVDQLAGEPMQKWQGICAKAKDLIRERLSANPGDGLALSYLALIHTLMGQFKDAVSMDSEALRVSPGDIDVLYNSSRMYALHGDKDQALKFLTKAVERQYKLASVLDMDFSTLRSDPDFLNVIVR